MTCSALSSGFGIFSIEGSRADAERGLEVHLEMREAQVGPSLRSGFWANRCAWRSGRIGMWWDRRCACRTARSGTWWADGAFVRRVDDQRREGRQTTEVGPPAFLAGEREDDVLTPAQNFVMLMSWSASEWNFL